MLEKISNLFEDFLILITQCLFWAYAIALLLVVFTGLAIPLTLQVLEWLRDGVALSRDGFWLYALFDCGEGWCRPELVAPTDWVGVNRIINWIMELHVAIYSIVIGWVGFNLAFAWAESISNWKALEEGLRRGPIPPDPDDGAD